MTLDEFKHSLEAGAEAAGLTPALRALWWAAKGDWDGAHEMANAIESPIGAWIHAHLHRQEGDLSNARYWYTRAGRPEFTGSIGDEWEEIVAALLAGESLAGR